MTTVTTEEVRVAVNKVVEICLDGALGFEAAANAINDPDVKKELAAFSNQRRDFTAQLQTLLNASGQPPAEHGTISGALHRGWLNLKQSLAGDNDYAILAECERGEDAAVKAYRVTLDRPLTEVIFEVIESQYRAILRSHDRVKALRDMAQAESSA